MSKVSTHSKRRKVEPDPQALVRAIHQSSLEELADEIVQGWDLNSLEDKFRKRDEQVRGALIENARVSGRPLWLVKREFIMSALMLNLTPDPRAARRTAERQLLGEILPDQLVGMPELEDHLVPTQDEPAEEYSWLENADVDLEVCLGVKLPPALLRIAWSVHRDPSLSRKERAAELGLQPDTIHKEMGRLRRTVKAARVSDVGLCDSCLEALLAAPDLSPDAHDLVHDMWDGLELTYEQRDTRLGRRVGHSRRLLWEIERYLAAA